jgi:hypothetical protein
MKTIEISDELAEALSAELCEGGATDISALSDFVGKKLFIRTVTYHLVGKVKAVNGNLIELADASWVANSGRFMQAIKDGTLSEVEPVGTCWVNANAVTDMFPWNHVLPKDQK